MITSNSNAKIKHVSLLITSSKARKQEGCFVVEGERIVREIPTQDILECFVAESYVDKLNILDGLSYEVVSDSVFKKMSDTMTPQGVLCVVRCKKIDVAEILDAHLDGEVKLLVLERIQDPGNLGTMIRTAEAAGFDAIIADNNTVDIYNPKVTRSTMGSLFRMPVAYTDNLLGVLDKFSELGITTYAAHLRGTSDFDKIEYSHRSAVLIGNEGNGLTDEISSKCDTLVKIPMKGKIESLNASVAAALMMYEVRR